MSADHTSTSHDPSEISMKTMCCMEDAGTASLIMSAIQRRVSCN
ncbi:MULTISPECIES: hypothetical protein [unclassified Streptomyces]